MTSLSHLQERPKGYAHHKNDIAIQLWSQFQEAPGPPVGLLLLARSPCGESRQATCLGCKLLSDPALHLRGAPPSEAEMISGLPKRPDES
ncbi:hypothetical protein PCANC_18430 [Puccinia coronata f. sp. avenae]|uniref:Uncharacterized protein n=1 Tax=Puccinia coronata f. sp. avenae TaxID=200324 RepID=A0A2N5SK74_9BASI|nr:hypothetical protein PCANC_18430 [Puccinia coronata f. sp. avenae]PLW36656.1 hypothetical protein PCASD_14136 [Puccinia coronata f. sp. avenae]